MILGLNLMLFLENLRFQNLFLRRMDGSSMLKNHYRNVKDQSPSDFKVLFEAIYLLDLWQVHSCRLETLDHALESFEKSCNQ